MSKIYKPPNLAALPYDLLHEIVSHIPDARSIANLSRACKSLHRFTTTGRGWQIFVQSRFPSLCHPEITGGATEWRRRAQEFTSLSRNYDRRAFVAQSLQPDLAVMRRRRGGGRGAGRGRGANMGQAHGWGPPAQGRGQTAGFRPVLDAWAGEGNDALAVGAGQDLLVRRRARVTEKWCVFRDPAHVAGRDDVTTLKMLSWEYGHEKALVGRANGDLEIVGLGSRTDSAGPSGLGVLATLDTIGRSIVRASAVLDGADRTVASVLGNDLVAVHRLTDEMGDVEVAGTLVFDSAGEQPWNVQFLGPGRLAVGKSSGEPLAVYTLTPSGLSTNPERVFMADECAESKTSSVQPISGFADMGSSPDVFLAGWYSGATLWASTLLLT